MIPHFTLLYPIVMRVGYRQPISVCALLWDAFYEQTQLPSFYYEYIMSTVEQRVSILRAMLRNYYEYE